MGGKATDASWILGKLGVPNRALGFAAGPNGLRMENMLRERGVETDFVWVDGETRLNSIIDVPGEGQSTTTSSSLHVSPERLAEFSTKYQKVLEGASCVVMGGSLPNGAPLEFYAEVIARAHEHNVPVIFDSSGPSLLAGMKSSPDLIRPNQAELDELLGYVPNSQQEVRQAAQRLHDEFGSNVIITLGSEGAVAVFGDDSYFVHPMYIPVVSAAGAGDGVLAGMALACLRDESLQYGLPNGFALAGVVQQTLGTADFRVEDYEELLPQIRIERL